MKRVIGIILCMIMLTSQMANAEVIWNDDMLANGSLNVTVTDIEAGDRVTAAVFDAEGILRSSGTKISTDKSESVSFNYTAGDYARIFVWDKESLSSKGVYTSRLTADGVDYDAVFSDNQQPNRTNDVVGYRSFDPISGDYEILLDVTLVKKGDNAIMLGDSSNGILTYGTCSAILLFNGDNFSVRDGNGSGGYAAATTVLCPAEEGKTYRILIKGNASENRYTVKIDNGEKEYTSNTIHARKNGAKLDTIALISNGKNTVVKNGCYSNFAFFGTNMSIETENIDPMGVYDGFAGLFYAIKVDGKYIRGNNGKVTADYTSVKDDSAKFFVKDMGDGSYAMVCKSSNNRMTIPDSDFASLKSSGYNPNNNSQHWILEESANYSKDNLSYYIKHVETGKYVQKALTGLIMSSNGKSEFVFEMLNEDSVLYRVSKTESYRSLSERARFMLESVYSSVAGDMFGRYGGYTDWTPKIRMDNLFNEILSGKLTIDEQKTKLDEFLNDTNGFIYSNQASYEKVSVTLPGSVGCYTEVGEGISGTYDFWRGTQLSGVKYPVTIYNADGNKEQTLTVYVHDNDVAKHNYSVFLKTIVNIPYEFRTRLKNVKIRNDTANSFNGGGSDVYVRLNWKMEQDGMRSTLVHELGHIIDQGNGNWASGGGWSSAISRDMYTPSTYGATNNAEDFAEFCRIYFQCYNMQDMQRALKIIMPERYASFGRLRKNNMDGWGLWADEYTK